MSIHSKNPTAPSTATAKTLLEITGRYGTPTYAYDVRRLRGQVEKLIRELPDAVEILYSLKANASLGICDVFADCGIGADVASAGELATAVEAGFPADRILVAGPYKSPETISQLRALPEAVISVDSSSELQQLADEELPNHAVLRLRPDFESAAIVVADSDSRFGIVLNELPQCREYLGRVNVIGFHVFAGSQVLCAQGIVEHLRGAMSLALRAADLLGIAPEFLDFGGGFGIPYGPGQEDLDLLPIRNELETQIQRASPARVVLELGRFLVAQSGWYLTSVVGYQTHQNRAAVVVDGGTHQRADLCGLCLSSKAHPAVALDAPDSTTSPTDVLGCLSLPTDVLSQASALPPLSPGNVLAFANAGAYGLWSSPALFHGSPLPAEVAFDGTSITLMRPRPTARSILDDQNHVIHRGTSMRSE